MPAEMLAEIVDEIADHEPFAPFARWLEAAMRSEPLAGTWLARPSAPWQRQVAPAMERIIRAEAAAMRVTLASLLGDMRGPAGPFPPWELPTLPARRVAERGRSE